MVETKHFRLQESTLNENYHPIDHYVWAVEPNRDGGIYLWIPDSDHGFIKTGFTMKKLVEEVSPYADSHHPIVYTGDKKTTMMTLDAATGRVLKWLSSTGSHVYEAESCARPDTLYDAESLECSSTGTIALSRTEYTVSIHRRDNGLPVATLKYSEWSPNNRDSDLFEQHHSSLDKKYITSQHDGKVYAFDYARSGNAEPLFSEHFAAPVARVFDVCRPGDATSESNPDLVALPQPPMPPQDETHDRMRSNSIFLNQTRTGDWYVMSGRSYPLIIHAPVAQISRPEWWDKSPAWDTISNTKLSKVLVGTHFLDNESKRGGPHVPSLPANSIEAPRVHDAYNAHENIEKDESPTEVGFYDDPIFLSNLKAIPSRAARSIQDFITNPVMIIIFITVLYFNQKNLRQHLQQVKRKGIWNELQSILGLTSPFEEYLDDGESTDTEGSNIDYTVRQDSEESKPKEMVEKLTKTKEPPVPAPESSKLEPDASPEKIYNEAELSDREATPKPMELAGKAKPEPPAKASIDSNTQSQAKTASNNGGQNGIPSGSEKKKKAHRGRRGGVKHRKGRAQDASLSRGDDPAMATVEDAVNNAKKLGERPNLEPDVMTIHSDMQSVTGSALVLGNITVHPDEQLGTGSNGTLVFAGKFDDRDVAVKRMLIQFYDIASQETKLLRESDDHPNGKPQQILAMKDKFLTILVIRYYAQQIRDGFLYIALERCAASLADVIERPNHFRDLADAGRQDIPDILYQIANGVKHLHYLRIVHRDLKPQNILVSRDSNGKPRMLVSDFGLCKKLEGGQSSFGATTGRAAGTSGWRAPELLLGDEVREVSMVEASTQSGSGSVLADDSTASKRRATRSIDIFSLGLVFFYVLTNGSHPFDCGDRYMREVNIRKGQYNLDLLDSLGDSAHDAKDLIAKMISQHHKDRPDAEDVMIHPFFWAPKKKLAFLCDVSDHFEKEPRDPPSEALAELESYAKDVITTNNDFLKALPRDFVHSLEQQRKYSGSRLLDLLRAIRNKRNHYEDMSDALKRTVGAFPEGYTSFWTLRFPNLLISCWTVIEALELHRTDRFREYYDK
jgi:serine/threonine-protein kinase/endoribonuclease IRE1